MLCIGNIVSSAVGKVLIDIGICLVTYLLTQQVFFERWNRLHSMLSLALSISSVKTKHTSNRGQIGRRCLCEMRRKTQQGSRCLPSLPEWWGAEMRRGRPGAGKASPVCPHLYPDIPDPALLVVGHHPSPGYSRNAFVSVRNVIIFSFHSCNEHCTVVHHFRGPYVSDLRVGTMPSLYSAVSLGCLQPRMTLQ